MTSRNYTIQPVTTDDTRAVEPPIASGQAAQALAQLFRLHDRSLKSFLMARLGNEQEVQEVTQEAYARMLQLHQPGAISFLRAYLFKTAAHIAVDRARQRRIRTKIDQSLGDPDLIDSLGPDRHALASEELGMVEQALRELPPNYRRAFILRRYHESTPEEIAATLGTGTRMVRNYISRATIYCKLRLEGMPADEARKKVLA
jgi:RNA polymerase sigma-70 factor (ECF subfamily)